MSKKPKMEDVADLFATYLPDRSNPVVQQIARSAAQSVFALFQPDVVTTLDQLDELPIDTVIRNAHGLIAVRERDTGPRELDWQYTGQGAWFSPGRESLPATVLYQPEEA